MRKSYKFKLFYNRRKYRGLNSQLFVFCQIYNHSLLLIKRHYNFLGTIPKKYDLQKHLKRLMDRGLHKNWKDLGYSQGIQEVTDRIYLSYQAFFNWRKSKKGERKSPPRLRPFRKYRSFTLKQAGWKLDEKLGRVKIGKVWYRYNNSRKIIGVPKTINIKRDALGDWFISISCELEDNFIPKEVMPMTGKIAGFDFGLKSFLTSSYGDKYYSGEYLKTELKRLKQKSKSLSCKLKGSKNRKKARKSLARVHRKIFNKRTDAHFKLSLNLLRKYDKLFFEDLNLQGMKKLWGRKVSDYGFSDFLKILEFKSLEHGKNVFKIDRFFPSTKACSSCGSQKEISLKERMYSCPSCNSTLDRDLNASINILREGASSLGLDGIIPGLGQVSVV